MLLYLGPAFGQAYYRIYNSEASTESPDIKNASDSSQFIAIINNEINSLKKDGHLYARVKTIALSDSIYNVEILPGPKYKWVKLSVSEVPPAILGKASYKTKIFNDRPFKPAFINRLINNILKVSQNSGFPFASVRFDSVSIHDKAIQGVLRYESGPKITFDSIQYLANWIKPEWLMAYLNIKKGGPFDQAKIDRIPEKLDQLQFLKVVSIPQVTFQNEEAVVVLELEQVKSNQIDGIIGFLPNGKADGGTMVTGQFDMSLKNLFKSGKAIDMHWRSVKPRSQLLDLQYHHANFLHSPIGITGKFYFLKEDTIYTNRKGRIDIRYVPSEHAFTFFGQFEASRRLAIYEEGSLDEISDFNINYYGVSHQYSNLKSVALMPRGFSTDIEIAVGNKEIRVDPSRPGSYYEDIELESQQFFFQGTLELHQPIARQLGIYLRLSGAKLINDQLFLNDLFRIGGLQSLRGFNEYNFFAQEYGLANTELRYHYDQGSYLFLFYDQSYIYYNLRSSRFEDCPLGLGGGISLQTGRGTLQIAYALGKSASQPLSITLSKFHFGYVAKF